MQPSSPFFYFDIQPSISQIDRQIQGEFKIHYYIACVFILQNDIIVLLCNLYHSTLCFENYPNMDRQSSTVIYVEIIYCFLLQCTLITNHHKLYVHSSINGYLVYFKCFLLPTNFSEHARSCLSCSGAEMSRSCALIWAPMTRGSRQCTYFLLCLQ